MFYLSDDLHLEPHTLTFQRTAYILTSDSGSSKKLKTSWFSRRNYIKNELSNALGQLAVSIEHVGSTAVEGLSAKPIIDIDVVIEDYDKLDAVIDALGKIGYRHEGDLGILGREAFMYDC